jgi:hypothetical protein
MDKKNIKTAKILKRFEQQKELELSKSYIIVDFATEKAKNFAISHDFRLFGFKLESQTIYSDNADYKRTVMINNLTWGTDIKKFVAKINSILDSQNLPGNLIISDLKIEEPELSYLSTKYFIYVECASLAHSLRMIKVIN